MLVAVRTGSVVFEVTLPSRDNIDDLLLALIVVGVIAWTALPLLPHHHALLQSFVPDVGLCLRLLLLERLKVAAFAAAGAYRDQRGIEGRSALRCCEALTEVSIL